MNTTTRPATFTMICECFRCGGFRRAFDLSPVNGGRCLRCNGGLRDIVTKPIARLGEYVPASERRARAIATIAKVLGIVGAPAPRDENGRRVSEWGFAYAQKSDTCLIFAAAMTTAPDDVRVRGWRAFCAKARAAMGDRAEALIAATRARVVAFSGIDAAAVGAWLGEHETVAA